MKRICLLVALVLVAAGCRPMEKTNAEGGDAQTLTKHKYEILVLIESEELFLFCDGEFFKVYSVATGKTSTPTPKGDFNVVSKMKRPFGGVYGSRWIGLSADIGIHGANDTSSIGSHATNGCIRMRNEDIEELFAFVQIGMKVFIL